MKKKKTVFHENTFPMDFNRFLTTGRQRDLTRTEEVKKIHRFFGQTTNAYHKKPIILGLIHLCINNGEKKKKTNLLEIIPRPENIARSGLGVMLFSGRCRARISDEK